MKKKDILFYSGLSVFISFLLIELVILPLASSSTHVYTVVSGSMEPTLSVGDVIFVEKVGPRDIDQGDLIIFKRDGQTVTHRCVEIIHEPDGSLFFRTKGDANKYPDIDLVTGEKLIGKVPSLELLGRTVYLKIPRLGYLSYFLHTFLGYILLIVIPYLLLIGIEVYDIFNLFFSEDESDIPKYQT